MPAKSLPPPPPPPPGLLLDFFDSAALHTNSTRSELGQYEGSTWNSVLIGLLALTVLINIANFVRPRKSLPRVLRLRRLLPSSTALSAKTHENVFVEEFMLLFEMTGVIIDEATPKWVGQSVPMITAQEHTHHAHHTAAIKERAPGWWRWSWLDAFGRLVMLHSGPLSIASIGALEAGSLPFFFIPVFMPFIRSSVSSLFCYHGLEEIEHGALTGQCLIDECNLFWRILGTVGNVGFLCIHFLMPPVVRLIWQPSVLFSPRCYVDFVLYYLVMIPATLVSSFWMFWHFVLRMPESQWVYSFAMDFMNELVAVRGVKFDIVKTAAYALQM